VIFQIAAGVCLGIVVAVLVLINWRVLLKSSIFLLAGMAVLLAVAAAATAIYTHREGVANAARAIFIFGAFFGPAVVILAVANRRSPAFAYGRPPWDRGFRAYARILFVVAAVAAGFVLVAVVGRIARAFGLVL